MVKNDQGESRRFAFIGFKGRDTGQMIKKKYDNTYLGASKVKIDVARIQG